MEHLKKKPNKILRWTEVPLRFAPDSELYH